MIISGFLSLYCWRRFVRLGYEVSSKEVLGIYGYKREFVWNFKDNGKYYRESYRGGF